jgi:hypothetical protein
LPEELSPMRPAPPMELWADSTVATVVEFVSCVVEDAP